MILIIEHIGARVGSEWDESKFIAQSHQNKGVHHTLFEPLSECQFQYKASSSTILNWIEWFWLLWPGLDSIEIDCMNWVWIELSEGGGGGQISDSALSHYRDLAAFFSIHQRNLPLLSSSIWLPPSPRLTIEHPSQKSESRNSCDTKLPQTWKVSQI